jgi:hypothetical protein
MFRTLWADFLGLIYPRCLACREPLVTGENHLLHWLPGRAVSTPISMCCPLM